MIMKGARMNSIARIVTAVLLCAIASVASAEVGGSKLGVMPLEDGKYRYDTHQALYFSLPPCDIC